MKQKYEMTADQKRRMKKALKIGIPLAAIPSFLGAGLTGYFSAMVFAGISAAVITGSVIWLTSKLVFTAKESKARGAAFGFLGGGIALYLAVTVTLFFGWYFQIEGPNPDPEFSIFVSSDPLKIPLIAIAYTIVALIFGGFMGPVIGAVIGHSMSRNQSQNDIIADTFE